MSSFELTGRRVLVTGGARGLGAGMATAMAAAGASVMIADVLKDVGEQTAADLARSGATARFVELDVTDDAQWEAAVARTVSELGGLDVVVNNAGVEVTQLLVDTEADDVRRMLDINLLGTMLGIKHGFRAMRPGGAAGGGGTIINLASVAASIAFSAVAGYSATKSGVDRLTRVAAMESGKLGYGVRVNCIYPGLVATDMGVKLAVETAGLGLFESPEAAVGAVVELTRRAGSARSPTSPTPWCSWPPTHRGSSTASGCRSTAGWGCDVERRSRARGPRLMSLTSYVDKGASRGRDAPA